MTTGILEMAGALVAGGGITALTTYLINRRREDRSDFEAIVETLSADNTRLRTENLEMRIRISHLEAQVARLEDKLNIDRP